MTGGKHMPREYGRNKRIADQVQREIAGMVQREQNTLPHLQLVTISYVDVSPDLATAKIFVTSMGEASRRQEVIDTLNELAGHFRHQLSKLLTSRSVPKLKFFYDHSVERGTYLSALIDSLNKDKSDN
jgi:ribosome-binding factor A